MGRIQASKAQDFSGAEEGSFDWRLILTAITIMLLSLVNVYSATYNGGAAEGGASLMWRQLAHFAAGFAIIAVILSFDYRIFERVAYIFYGLNIVMLLVVPFFGVVRGGARRWLDLGFFSYQPSETMKFAAILALAKYFNDLSSLRKMDFKNLLIPGLIVGVPSLLIMIQPDLGTGGHLALIGAAILVFVGIRSRVLMTAFLLAVVSFPIAWQYGLKDYQKTRIKTFINPMEDPKGKGYNALQSMIAVGSGELFGKGFQKGTQTQLDFTPEGHTDFIFTVLAEEWGLLGCLLLFSLYLYLFHRCVHIASRARDKFGSLACVGIIVMLGTQIAINVAMVTGMFPIVGIPLPLLSYGGTSVITVCVALGILLNVGYRHSMF